MIIIDKYTQRNCFSHVRQLHYHQQQHTTIYTKQQRIWQFVIKNTNKINLLFSLNINVHKSCIICLIRLFSGSKN